MAVLAPPPPSKSKKRPSQPVVFASPPRDQHWKEKLTRSGYFLGAVLLHLVIFVMIAAWVVFQPPKPPPTDFQTIHVPTSVSPPPLPPPHQPDNVILPSHINSGPAVIINPNGRQSFTLPPPTLSETTIAIDQPRNTPVAPRTHGPEAPPSARLKLIRNFIKIGQNRKPEDIIGSDNNPINYHGKFVVFLASYADGDWNCNVTLKDGAIQAGSLPDLVAKVNEWSHGNIDATVVPTPLNIGGTDLMDKKPPFIFFTGHKDFHLTDQEVSNLQDYLQNGGAILGDNCLPGSGSRFDVAFHREMKRVIPDLDKQFEKVPMDHDIYTKSYATITELPQGMNYYNEPLEHLDLDGVPAIIYTPNDYSDLMTMRILPGDKTFEGPQPPFGSTSPLFTYWSFTSNANIFFRNFNLPACLKAQQLERNIIGYLLVRFDKYFLLGP
jgi:hypothetical protein